jgi:hypothetical protein
LDKKPLGTKVSRGFLMFGSFSMQMIAAQMQSISLLVLVG